MAVSGSGRARSQAPRCQPRFFLCLRSLRSLWEGKTPPPWQSPPLQDHFVPLPQTMLHIDLSPPSPDHSYKNTLSCAHRVMGKECHLLPNPRALGSHTHYGTCSFGDRHTHTKNIQQPGTLLEASPTVPALGVL